MARAIAGGLAFSTVVSLLFLPTIYALLDDLRASTGQLFARARGKIARAQHQSNEDDDDESDEAIPTL
jgi:HAE1 family hydrophobic/amphiphilic exporter-1